MTHTQQTSNMDDDSGTVDLEERIRKYGHINIAVIHTEEIYLQLTLSYYRIVSYRVTFRFSHLLFLAIVWLTLVVGGQERRK